MCSRVGTGQRLSQRIEYWIEYDGNHPNEQGNATDVVMGGVQWMVHTGVCGSNIFLQMVKLLLHCNNTIRPLHGRWKLGVL